MTASQMNRSRWKLGLGLVATATFAMPAVAEPPAATNSTSGLMTFPNVRVVNGPVAQPSAPSATGAGMRAAVDPQTGRLRQLTAEEAQTLSAPAKAKAALKDATARRATTASESATDSGQTLYGPGNAVGVTLGDEAQVYQVARKGDEGLQIEEYTGKAAADRAAIHGVSGDAQKVEVKHGR